MLTSFSDPKTQDIASYGRIKNTADYVIACGINFPITKTTPREYRGVAYLVAHPSRSESRNGNFVFHGDRGRRGSHLKRLC